MSLLEEYISDTGCRMKIYDDFIVQTVEEKERIDTNLHLYYWSEQLKRLRKENGRYINRKTI